MALLAILKSGAAYVQLDPDYPAERLRYMVEDAAPRLLVAGGASAPAGVEGPQRILLDEAETQAALAALGGDDLTDADRRAPLRPQNPAYVIYTSGSTGKPKGVVVQHGAVVNRLEWMQDAYPLEAADRILQKTPAGFDVSVWEFFWPLITGATLVVAEPGLHGDPRYLADVLVREKITTLHFVPSMLEGFLLDETLRASHSIRRVFCSGEALSDVLLARFRDETDIALHNAQTVR